MKIDKIIKTSILVLALLGVAACSSTSDEEAAAGTQQTATGESGIDATTRRTQELEEIARQRAMEAEERMRDAAMQTNVFYFDFDIAEFRDADRAVLTFHAQDLAANPARRIRLEGHADKRGTREYNLALGERRAQSIMNFLIVNGAGRNQIEVVSYGEERLADSGSSDQAHQRNRRVEIVAR